MRSAWKTRFAGWPSPKRRGAGIAALTTSTRSPVRSKGCSARRRTIARAIWREKRSSPKRRKMSASSRSPASLTRSRAERGADGVHAHVERRVAGVGEAPLGPVDLHARDAEVEQDRVCFDAVVRELGEHDGEVAAKEACLRRRPALEALEVRAHARVLVDRDEAPVAREVGCEELRARRRRTLRRRPSRRDGPRGARAPRPRGRGRGQRCPAARRSATSSALPSTSSICSRQALRPHTSRWSPTPATTTSRLSSPS